MKKTRAPKQALLSVSDKSGVEAFAQGLVSLGFEILATGGTYSALEKAGIKVKKISEVTGFPEILGGRVKSLHPKIFGGILARSAEASDGADLEKNQIAAISVVCVNLYPFAQTIAKGAVTLASAIEQIDIGGPSMIRAAAKNFEDVWVVVDPKDYERVLQALPGNDLAHALRFELAGRAFAHTAEYDGLISQYLSGFENLERARAGAAKMSFPARLHPSYAKVHDLRYGENPHQKGALYAEGSLAAAPWQKLHGKELSFNNILDAHAVWQIVRDFTLPACAIVKHTNPCGVALHEKNLLSAFEAALACDPMSAFGGIVAFNRALDEEVAAALSEPFFEVILAPDFSEQALAKLTQKKNVRLLAIQALESPLWDFKRVAGGLLVEDWDTGSDTKNARVVTKRRPTESEALALDFAWRVVRHVKSNAIVLVHGTQTIGIGAGQMSRVDAVKMAQAKIKGPCAGCVMASDAFFPFRDGVDLAFASGVSAIVQPGGSVRDEEVIQAADEHQMAMIFTAMRHFKH